MDFRDLAKVPHKHFYSKHLVISGAGLAYGFARIRSVPSKQSLSAIGRGNPDLLQYPTRGCIGPFTPSHRTATKSPTIAVCQDEPLAIIPGCVPHYEVVTVLPFQNGRDPG